ncbi:MAG: FlgD immunoglobulin-like domain containing protein [Candidatus Latescibacteria bacterium]|nr:FlgD immunoglobulin-like domain containing protein [Candidatus Latescibacterota bacterium]MEC8930767.1 FlgD immunoglobulin-like domain containing protein [Candidatus Latescibacterota bacterium]MEE3039768.1 FlgD immunoglobulin-like domain containing protein [Candidatus Latescibacterota bacterium]MEE3262740.1 FlgD immunoglobulin-like domain containing protein [Candidatus Latescibacterota bacterium]MEE3335070.1 FlgD immunoglobulin-like domain containing protein [Candidatus Latescibacterota bact
MTIRRAQLSAGPHRLQWDGRDDDGRSVATGIYFYRLTTPTRAVARKLLLIR